MPKRIQRLRSKGWKAPEGAVYVGRPSKWGNPFKVDADHDAAAAVRDFRAYATGRLQNMFGYPLRELRGKDLMCWCPLDQPCHADVLLELANAETTLENAAGEPQSNSGSNPPSQGDSE